MSWEAGVLSAGYGLLPQMVARDRGLKYGPKALLMYFMAYLGAGEDICFPTPLTVQQDLGINENTYFAWMKVLEDGGYLKRERRYPLNPLRKEKTIRIMVFQPRFYSNPAPEVPAISAAAAPELPEPLVEAPEPEPRVKKLHPDVEFLLRDILRPDLFSAHLPEEGQPPTKTLLKAQEILIALREGRMAADYPIDVSWGKSIGLDKVALLPSSWEDVRQLLDKAVRRYARAHDPQYMPEDKKKLSRDFCSWLYNPRTQRSSFLLALCVPPQRKTGAAADLVAASIPEPARSIAAAAIPPEANALVFWERARELRTWYDKMAPVLEGLNPNWYAKEFQGLAGFMKSYYSWARENHITADGMGTKTKPWSWYIQYMASNGMNLAPTAAKIRANRAPVKADAAALPDSFDALARADSEEK